VDNDAAALDLIRHLISRPNRVDHAYTDLQLRETAPKALLPLLESIYWQRTWAAQEELPSRNDVQHFGTQCLPWSVEAMSDVLFVLTTGAGRDLTADFALRMMRALGAILPRTVFLRRKQDYNCEVAVLEPDSDQKFVVKIKEGAKFLSVYARMCGTAGDASAR
jgi:hypothetical protein